MRTGVVEAKSPPARIGGLRECSRDKAASLERLQICDRLGGRSRRGQRPFERPNDVIAAVFPAQAQGIAQDRPGTAIDEGEEPDTLDLNDVLFCECGNDRRGFFVGHFDQRCETPSPSIPLAEPKIWIGAPANTLRRRRSRSCCRLRARWAATGRAIAPSSFSPTGMDCGCRSS